MPGPRHRLRCQNGCMSTTGAGMVHLDPRQGSEMNIPVPKPRGYVFNSPHSPAFVDKSAVAGTISAYTSTRIVSRNNLPRSPLRDPTGDDRHLTAAPVTPSGKMATWPTISSRAPASRRQTEPSSPPVNSNFTMTHDQEREECVQYVLYQSFRSRWNNIAVAVLHLLCSASVKSTYRVVQAV